MANDTPVVPKIEYKEGGSSPKDKWLDISKDIKAKMGSARYDILTPEQLSRSQQATVNNAATQKNTNLVWTDSGISDFSTTLFVDTSEVDPAEQNTKNAFTIVKVFLDRVYDPDGRREGPRALPLMKYTYADFVFDGFLTKLDEKYVYFSSKGFPLRAELSFTIRKLESSKKAAKKAATGKSRSVRVVKAGDRLDLIADDYYGDPTLWREIAAENNIQRPRLFPETGDLGRELFLPDLAAGR